MNKFSRVTFLMLSLCSFTLLTSCDEENPPLPENKIAFQSSAQGLGANDTELTVNITLVREAEIDGSILVAVTPTGVEYGIDFMTEPATVDNVITIPIPAGATTASFKLTKTTTAVLDGDEKVVFQISSVSTGLEFGEQASFELSFSEVIATSATMKIDGGGINANNRVFIDLSGNRQTAIARTAWDLAFSSKADEFRVYLNGSNKMFARAIDKNDLATVTAADTVGFGAQLDFNAIFGALAGDEIPDWVAQTTSWIDNPSDLTVTAIAAINETASENAVYIVNRGEDADHAPLGWMKLRVIRDGANYQLQYADIGSDTYETVTVTKNSATNLTYVSLVSGEVVTVEPDSGDWDLAWTGLMNEFNFGVVIPYYFQDIVIQNTNGVSTAEILTSEVSYDAFAESNLADIEFIGNDQLNIGSKWRTLPQSGTPSVSGDRFYLIKDAEGNVYKLQFTSLMDNGERGKPSFKFDLVKKGS